MCSTVKSPTPKDPEKKDPIYLRNPYLDGLGISGESRGRNSLRIDPGSPVPTPADVFRPNPIRFGPAGNPAPTNLREVLGRGGLGISVP